jgi:Domain of unknown function (DUF4913)
MPDTDDRRDGPSDLDAADLAAIRRAMEGLRESPSPRPAVPGGSAAAGQFAPRYTHLESWVNEFFVLTFGRAEGQVFWCPRWWAHPEAVLRLDALWRTWEATALDPVHGLAEWIRDHLDPNLAVLLGPAGPFAACQGGRHVETAVLPVDPTPADWWSPPRHWWEVLGESDR